MALRRPAAHLPRSPGWRRSGDASCWESFMSEGDVSQPSRTRRPQSAVEGGRLDGWLEHLHAMQSDPHRAPLRGPCSVMDASTGTMATPGKEQTGSTWTYQGTPAYRRGSSSSGSPGLCESSLGSWETLHTGLRSPPERRGSCETVRFTQAPQKEQAQLSFLAPVKVGWLPIQRRVMRVADACRPKQFLDQSACQVKLKQPITPTLMKNQVVPKAHGGEVKESHTTSCASGAKTLQTADQSAAIIKQVPEKQSSPAGERSRALGWQALRRGWNTVRDSAFPGCSRTTERPTGADSDPKTTSGEPLKHPPPHGATSTQPCRPHTLLRGTSSTEAYRPHTSAHRTSSVQPVKATAPLLRAEHSGSPQASAAVTTLTPQNKAGFSSITISSRKVSRSASLPDAHAHSSQSWRSQSPSPLPHQPMDPNSRHVTVQRKATIVKVTEQRVTSGPVPGVRGACQPPAGRDVDTVVRRRKATIIKVTEHRESYSPARTESGARQPQYRHSYTDGLHKDSDTGGSYHLDHMKKPNVSAASELEKNGGTLHRSTLSLFVSHTPAIAAPAPSEVPLRAVGQRSEGRSRPLSCYGSVFGHADPSEETVTRPAARKWSFGLPQETGVRPASSSSSFIWPGSAEKEAGQEAAHNLRPNSGENETHPAPEDAARRASTSLTLIQAPDPHSRQSAEEVLALNAAAVIANIKLQRQLSKKKTQTERHPENDSAASHLGNTVTDTCAKPQPDQSPHAAFVPLTPGPESSPEPVSLQEALQRSRPDFIRRSQGRLQELERRAQERRERARPVGPQSGAAPRQRAARRGRFTPMNDNCVKPRDGVMTGKETHLGFKCKPAEVKRKTDGEKNREVCLTNRHRVELFKKKLLDQILHRSST